MNINTQMNIAHPMNDYKKYRSVECSKTQKILKTYTQIEHL